MKYALTLALVLALSLVANAATFTQTAGSVTVTAVPDLTTPASTGLTAFIVTISSPVGIYSVDGRIDATTGYLNQCWNLGGTTWRSTPIEDVNGNWGYLDAQHAADDTNIMVDPTNMVVDRAPAENRTVAATVAGNNGNWLAFSATQTMAFGFQGLTSYNSIPLARVVLATGAVADFKFNISDSNKANDAFDMNIVAPIPEPMTLSLLGAGALALIRRRR
jgi:hypothetical protein